MEIYGFENICEVLNDKVKARDQNPLSQKILNDRDMGKARDKFTELLDAIGLDRDLLKTDKAIKDADGRSVKSGSYIFPKGSVDFCADLILNYTSPDYKKMRKAKFEDMSLDEVIFLIVRFTDMLYDLGHPDEVVLEQYHAMRERMKLNQQLAVDEIETRFKELHELTKKYKEDYLAYSDKVYFLRYVANRIKETSRVIESVHESIKEIRFDEISEKALKRSYKDSSRISAERMNKELAFFAALEHDDEYQKLLNEMEELFAQDTFIKNKQQRFNKIGTQLNKIREQHQMELFGELLYDEDEDEDRLTLDHPLTVLMEAMEYSESLDKDQIERAEAEAAKSPEDIELENAKKEELLRHLEAEGYVMADLPDTTEQEEDIL